MESAQKTKYTIKDFRGMSIEERSFTALVAIANELHNIYSLLWEIREKKQ